MSINKMRPIHPGEILADELEVLNNMSASQFAKHLAVPPNRITGILNGNRAISADTALRLSKFFGSKPEFWLNLQDSYDLKVVEQKAGKKIAKEVSFLGNIMGNNFQPAQT
jgi:addiction module HigA family antidote